MKRQLGQFMTNKADLILSGYEQFVQKKDVVDLFCGKRDLLQWAKKNGAKSVFGYDVDSTMDSDEVRDTLMDPPVIMNGITVINPPYLYRNKADNKAPFDKWKTTDLYKASLLAVTTPELIAIVPSNFIFDNDDKFRQRFYSRYEIIKLTLFDSAVFDDTTVRVCVFYAKWGETKELLGEKLWNTRVGERYYRFIDTPNVVKRLRIGDTPNSTITLQATDKNGRDKIKLFIRDKPYFGKQTDRNLATFILPEYAIGKEDDIVFFFNFYLAVFRLRYNSAFLTNFLAGTDGTMRKRMAFNDAMRFISKVICFVNILEVR